MNGLYPNEERIAIATYHLLKLRRACCFMLKIAG
uniref:Uncharacterized protein n=1 Tax=Siphoviridae sp. ctrfD19 TaxID=2826478 RepID=A0A8S5M1V2_9CAUD|nr:MAG TPA: hypothetical protein [Siphoviridae sp. ctrfD19]